jgi:hypothetical protein
MSRDASLGVNDSGLGARNMAFVGIVAQLWYRLDQRHRTAECVLTDSMPPVAVAPLAGIAPPAPRGASPNSSISMIRTIEKRS